MFPVPPVAKRFCVKNLDRREIPGSIPDRACRSIRSEFSVIFLWTSCKYSLGSLRKTLMEGSPPTGPGPTSGQLALILHPSPLFPWISWKIKQFNLFARFAILVNNLGFSGNYLEYLAGSRNCAARQRALRVILDLANKSSKRNII